jgi:hypothetical protein
LNQDSFIPPSEHTPTKDMLLRMHMFLCFFLGGRKTGVMGRTRRFR